MSKVIDLFLQFAHLPRCSYHAQELKKFIIDFCLKHGCDVNVDNVGNIVARKGEPRLAFQGHYDMVCVGESPAQEIVIEKGWMFSRKGSLGADNGIAVAMMLMLIEEYDTIECLFTADEEVGFLGASGCELSLKSHYLINLDSETLGEIVISSAGGVEFDVQWHYPEVTLSPSRTVVINDLEGGHSGVDIDKNIPCAILEALKCVSDDEMIIQGQGGEKSNAIARHASFDVVMAKNTLTPILKNLPHGVLAYDENHNVLASVNFATLKITPCMAEASFYARAGSQEALEETIEKLKQHFLISTPYVTIRDSYAPWREESQEPFVNHVKQCYHSCYPSVKLSTIHAGLECGVLKEKLSLRSVVSLGPTIIQPHSLHERLSCESVEIVTNVIKLLQINKDFGNI